MYAPSSYFKLIYVIEVLIAINRDKTVGDRMFLGMQDFAFAQI